MRWAGFRDTSRAAATSRVSIASSPSWDGGDGTAPVAITKLRALIVASPATTVLRSTKRPSPRTTVTPKASSRSAETFAATASVTARTCSLTLAGLTWSGAPVTPKAGPRRSVS